MNPSGKTNQLRRKMTRFLSRKIVHKSTTDSSIRVTNTDVRSILISRLSHRLGNALLLTPLVDELSILYPNASIHLFVKGDITKRVFQHHERVTKIITLPRKPFNHPLKYLSQFLSIRVNRYDISINAIKSSSSITPP